MRCMFLNPVTKFSNQRHAVKLSLKSLTHKLMFRLRERECSCHLKMSIESLKSASRLFLYMLTNMPTLLSNPSKARIVYNNITLLL